MAKVSKSKKELKKKYKAKEAGMRKQLKKLGISTKGLNKKQLNKRIKQVKLERAVVNSNAANLVDPMGHDNSEMLTLEEFRYTLPVNLRTFATEKLYGTVVDLVTDPDVGSIYRDNIISFSKVLDPQFSNINYNSGQSIQRYLKAVKFCTFKLMGATNVEAFARVNPKKYAEYKIGGKKKTLEAAVSTLSHSKMVIDIMNLGLLGSHIVYQDYYAEAILKSVELMRGSRSERIQMESSHFLATHLQAPETAKIDLNITNQQQSSALNDLRSVLKDMASEQQASIQSGMLDLNQVAKQKLVPKITKEEEEASVMVDPNENLD